MPIQQTYKTGTITVVSGSATVTGSGTFWSAGLVNGGELSFKGFSIPIIAVGSDTSLTLDYAAPAAMAGSGAYSVSLGRADASSAIVANRLLADLTDLLRSKVSPFAATFLDDLTPAAVRQTIGAVAASDVPAELTAEAILTKLLTVDTDTAGINATTLKSVVPSIYGLSLLDDATASAALTTLGVSTFIKTLLDDADQASARTTLGAQANLGFNPVQQGTGVGQNANTIKIGWNGSFPKMTVDTADLGRIWTDSETAKSRVANGYEKLPSGLVLQWGTSAVSLAEYNLSLPIAFLNACFGVWASVGYPGGAYPANYAYTVGIDGFNTVGFNVRKRLSTPGNVAMASDGVNIQWFALGY